MPTAPCLFALEVRQHGLVIQHKYAWNYAECLK